MRRLFQFMQRGHHAAGVAQRQLADLHDAQLAISSHAHGTVGDCLWIRASSTRVVFALLEASGRGQEKNELLASADAAIREAAPQSLSAEETNEADAMVEICSRLNHALLRTSKRIVSCTAFCGCYNERLGTVCYINAGHIPALLAHEGHITELQATGLPLGLFSHSTPDAPTVAVPPGAALLVTSRRLIHANSRGSRFGFGRLRESLLAVPPVEAEELCRRISADLQQFMGKRRIHDMSLLALSRPAAAVAAAG
jgi:serine phosphatase RsbU (regulator of sigma subunit)